MLIILLLSSINVLADTQLNDGPEPNNPNYIHLNMNTDNYWVYINSDSQYDYVTASFDISEEKVTSFTINDSDGDVNVRYLNVYINGSTIPEYKNRIDLYRDLQGGNIAKEARLSLDEFITELTNKNRIDCSYIRLEELHIHTLEILEIGTTIMYQENVIVEPDIIIPPIQTYDIYGQVFYEFDFLNSHYDMDWIKAVSSKGLAVVRQALGDGHFTTVDIFPHQVKMGYLKKRYIMQFRHPENTILKIQSTVRPVPTDITFWPSR